MSSVISSLYARYLASGDVAIATERPDVNVTVGSDDTAWCCGEWGVADRVCCCVWCVWCVFCVCCLCCLCCAVDIVRLSVRLSDWSAAAVTVEGNLDSLQDVDSRRLTRPRKVTESPASWKRSPSPPTMRAGKLMFSLTSNRETRRLVKSCSRVV